RLFRRAALASASGAEKRRSSPTRSTAVAWRSDGRGSRSSRITSRRTAPSWFRLRCVPTSAKRSFLLASYNVNSQLLPTGFSSHLVCPPFGRGGRPVDYMFGSPLDAMGRLFRRLADRTAGVLGSL